MSDWREFRKTATVEAVQVTFENAGELAATFNDVVRRRRPVEDSEPGYWALEVSSREGLMSAPVAERPYLCRGVEGEMWLVDKGIFEQTYEEVDGG